MRWQSGGRTMFAVTLGVNPSKCRVPWPIRAAEATGHLDHQDRQLLQGLVSELATHTSSGLLRPVPNREPKAD